MKKNNVFVFVIILVFLSVSSSDRNIVKLSVEIDGTLNDRPENLYVTIKMKDKAITPLMFKNGFIVPDLDSEWVDVTINYEQQKLFNKINHEYTFHSIHVSKFQGNWIFGIDKKPFEVHIVPKDKVSKMIYIKFNGVKGALNTCQVKMIR